MARAERQHDWGGVVTLTARNQILTVVCTEPSRSYSGGPCIMRVVSKLLHCHSENEMALNIEVIVKGCEG